jgi:hypothetical protein
MELERERYIINYFGRFFKPNEYKAYRHLMSLEKLGNVNENDNRLTAYKKMEWISSDPNVLELIKNGSNEFHCKVAERIVSENKDSVFFNECPNCDKLAKTPLARMCRYCGEKWFDSSSDFRQVDYLLNKWLPKYGLTIATQYKDEKVRSISVVDDNGNSYQIWIDPIKLNQIVVNASSLKNMKKESWKTETDLNDFEQTLNKAYSEIEKWITDKGNARNFV